MPDAAQDQQLLEGWQEIEAMRQLQPMGLRAVIQGTPVGCPAVEGLRQTLQSKLPSYSSCSLLRYGYERNIKQ